MVNVTKPMFEREEKLIKMIVALQGVDEYTTPGRTLASYDVTETKPLVHNIDMQALPGQCKALLCQSVEAQQAAAEPAQPAHTTHAFSVCHVSSPQASAGGL